MSSDVPLQSITLIRPGSPLFILPMFFMATVYKKYLDDNIEGHPRDQKKVYKEYDFIVVGAGSGGAVVANRLSENIHDKILLLEAGGDENEVSDVPALAAYLQLSDMDWQYKTEPQDSACLAMTGKRCNWPRGKVLGGSSVLNYMLYVRGNKKDYDDWEKAGCTGWGYKDILHYYKKSENNLNPYLRKNTKYHGTGGYLTVTESPWRSPLATAFVEAGVHLGYKNVDYNSRQQEGFMIPQGTLRKGSRCSTSKAFLRSIRHRRNLHIAKHSFVLKILIDPKTKRAYGVKVFRHGKTFVVYARKEVILSAGTINSAQLLMLSGIGPKKHLIAHQIPVLQDLPVGHNLQDHIAVGGLVFTVDKEVTLVQQRYENLQSTMQYVLRGTGPLTVMGGVEALGFITTKYTNHTDFPDIEYHFVTGSPGSDGGRQFRKIQGLTEEVWIKMFRPLAYKDTFNIFPKLLRPKSKGYITLRSSNPFHKPYITHNYLTEEVDLLRLVEGSKLAIKLAQTPAFRRYGARFYHTPIPGCEHFKVPSDDYLACLTRHYTATIYHPVGTAKMGPYWHKDAVVDPELKVYGISGLRVVDGSIMPKICSGNTNAPIIMIAEKASDMIKKYWENQR